MSLQALVIDLLGQGYEEREVAAIAELPAEDVRAVALEFASEILERRVSSAVTRRQTDQELDALELKLLEKMDLLCGYSNNLSEITRAFSVVNAAKRKTQQNGATESGSTFVRVDLPTTFVQNNLTMVVDSRNRVVEVGGRPMTSANNKQVQNLLDMALAQQEAQYQELVQARVADLLDAQAQEVLHEHIKPESITLADFEEVPVRQSTPT